MIQDKVPLLVLCKHVFIKGLRLSRQWIIPM
jgi:hypothetical protein